MGLRPRVTLTVAIAIVAAVLGHVAPESAPVRAESPATSTLVALEPCRVVDTRHPPHAGPIDPGGIVHVQMTSRCGVPRDAVAVAFTLTSVDPQRAGWLAVWPAGSPSTGTSTLNVGAGETRANSTVAALGRDGSVSVLVDAGGHVLVDVTGAFVPATAARAGRYEPRPMQRLVDTRNGGRPAPDSAVVVPLPTEVPGDTTALAVNITTTDSSGAGYFTAYPAGRPRPDASILNTDAAGQTRAASVIVPVTADGFEVYTSLGDHVIVDVSGAFTGPSAPESDRGLFVPVEPRRLVDTRADGERLQAGGTREWSPAELGSPPAAAAAVNVTMTRVRSDGFLAAHPSRTERPPTSTVNGGRGESVANLSVVPLSTAGLAVYASSGSDVVVDVLGWFLGPPVVTTGPAPSNVRLGPGRTLILGDSIPAALNLSAEALAVFDPFDLVFEAVECRRTVAPSCSSRGRPPPPTALETLLAAPGPFDTLVMVTGYNDPQSTFAVSIDVLVETARAAGVDLVVWLTVREDRANLVANNQHLRAATERHPELVLVDWNAHAAGQQMWFASDNVHLSRAGSVALARFIAERLEEIRSDGLERPR